MPAVPVARDGARAPRQAVRGAVTARTGPRPTGVPPLVPVGLYAVVLGVPLAILWEAAGPYDDPKAWALPILAAMTGLAWLWRGEWFGRAPSPGDPSSRLVGGIVLACFAWWAITTVTSIAPLQSVSGSFGRGMGLSTMGAAVLLFFLIRSECRTPHAVRSLVDIALVGSVPVCLLALGQAAGWDPLPRPWDPAVASLTVRSTFGTHIFLGSYLVVLIPLAAARLEWSFRHRIESGRWSPPTRAEGWHVVAGTAWVVGAVSLIAIVSHWTLVWWTLLLWGIVGAGAWALRVDRGEGDGDSALTASLLAALLAGQVLVVILCRGRGAFIGMMVGLSVTGFALLIRRRAWKTLAVAVLGVLGLATFIALLNLPGSPVASLRRTPLLARLSRIGDLRQGSPGWFRVQVWRGIVDGWSRQLRGEEIFPDLSPRGRAIIGYGPDTQLLVLDPLTSPFLGTLRARTPNGLARYVADRAHNVLLDHLVTEGLVGAGLHVLLVATVVAVGLSRIRASSAPGEATIRMGALGAVLGHLAEGQVGIETSMPLALFWLAAALATCDPWVGAVLARGVPQRQSQLSRRWRVRVLVGAACLVGLIAWMSTRWLLASVAYAEGARHVVAGRTVAAHESFIASVALAPWLPVPAEAAATTAFKLAGNEQDQSRRLRLLHEAEATLARARSYAMSGAGAWALAGQVAFAQARAGERSRLEASRDAFAMALRLRPGDPELLAEWGWAWLESGDPGQARRIAGQALAGDPRQWLAWMVVARSARELGDAAGAASAAGKARALAPPGVDRLVNATLGEPLPVDEKARAKSGR
jgi:cytochrome c-type biogenesis protein CcmH/NrfG